jgi:signal transduction histidine kinase
VAGVAPEDLPHLFERFRRIRPATAAGDVRLGLSIVKALVEAHGGAVGARTAPAAEHGLVRPSGGGTMITTQYTF